MEILENGVLLKKICLSYALCFCLKIFHLLKQFGRGRSNRRRVSVSFLSVYIFCEIEFCGGITVNQACQPFQANRYETAIEHLMLVISASVEAGRLLGKIFNQPAKFCRLMAQG